MNSVTPSIFSKIKYESLENTSSQLKLRETKLALTYKQSHLGQQKRSVFPFLQENRAYFTSTVLHGISSQKSVQRELAARTLPHGMAIGRSFHLSVPRNLCGIRLLQIQSSVNPNSYVLARADLYVLPATLAKPLLLFWERRGEEKT